MGRLSFAAYMFISVVGCGDNRSGPPRPVPSPTPADPVSTKVCPGTLSFGPAETIDLGVTVDYRQRELRVMDLDGDGRRDLVFYGGVTLEDRGLIATRRALAGGGFEATTTTYDAIGPSFWFDEELNFMSYTLVGDVDNDGRPDLMILGDTIQGVRSPGDGTLILPPVSATVRGEDASMATGDFDGDGIRDVLTRGQSAGPSPSAGVALFHGRGDGTFYAPVEITSAEKVYGIAALDVDNDGNMDVIVDDDRGGELLRGHGDGTFDPPESLGFAPGYLVAHDVDGDGLVDLVSGFEVGLNAGDGSFVAGPSSGAAFGIPVFGDLDGDGHLDIVINSDDTGSGVAVQFGRGDGTFDRPATFGGIYGTPSLVDVDGDGILDIVGPGTENTVVSVLRGHCN